MFNKVTSRSYGYFLKFSYFFLVEKWILPNRSEIAEIGKKTEGILGVNKYNAHYKIYCKLMVLYR
jgi:hypothetical protein